MAERDPLEGALAGRLEALRVAFDEAFARPPAALPEHRELLVIGAGDEDLAVPLDALAGVENASPITPLPSPQPALLGLANHRGAVVPVFSLAALLGRAGQTPRWFALVALAPNNKVALAFERLVERVRVSRTELAEGHTVASLHRGPDGFIPILDAVDLIARVTAPTVPEQET